jgi:hypothetical protein
MSLHEWLILKGTFKVKHLYYGYILIQASEDEAKETFYALIVIEAASQFLIEILLYQLRCCVYGLFYYIKVKLEGLSKDHDIHLSNEINCLELASNLRLASILKVFHIMKDKNLAYFSHEEY